MFWKSFQTLTGVTEVFKNSYINEIEDICIGIPGVRSILIDKKDLYIWNYDSCTHAEMLNNLKGNHKFTMVIIATDHDNIVFQKATYSCKTILTSNELIEIPVIKRLIGTKEPLLFAFDK